MSSQQSYSLEIASSSLKVNVLNVLGLISSRRRLQSRLLSILQGKCSSFLLRASGYAFAEPGRYIIQKLNQERNSDYCMCCGDSCFVVANVCKFLQSVTMSNCLQAPSSSRRHSSSALITARSSLLQMLQLHSCIECFAKKNTTSQSSPSLSSCKSVPLDNQLDTLVSTIARHSQLQICSVGTIVNACLSCSNAC